MDKKQAQKIADEIVEYLFLDNDKPRRLVVRLMLVYGGEEYKNPGWSRDAIKGAIVKQVLKSAKQSAESPLDQLGDYLPPYVCRDWNGNPK
jgi:hypothetical protein